MSKVVFQGLQSSLDSQLLETRTLKLKLASPKPPCFFEPTGLASEPSISNTASKDLIDKSHYEETNHMSFLQSPKETLDKESSYVHPMAKRSLSMLSDKSLELCTESLGSETGTDITESIIFSLSLSGGSNGGETPTREQPKLGQRLESRKVNSSHNFPPPLTTMTGSSSLRVRPYREGGRLVIEAVEGPSTQTYLQAERSHGRLRLCFWKDCSTSTFDSEMDIEENEDSDIEELENGADDEEKQDVEEKEEEEEFEEQEDEGESDVYVREDMNGNSLDVGVEMGMEKFQRPSRCKEGGRGNKDFCNLESFWVAT